MSVAGPLIGIDIGSSKVAVVVASPNGDQLAILGCGQARHDGARKGVIGNLTDVSEAIRVASEEAEAMAPQSGPGLQPTPAWIHRHHWRHWHARWPRH